MRLNTLSDMKRGWFVGDFEPSLLRTDDAEIGVKRYIAGDYELAHFHKIATEITVIITGEVEMNGVKYYPDDIITIEPGEATDFRALTDAVTVVVKHPGVLDDKYQVS